jgi:hypothetical protein
LIRFFFAKENEHNRLIMPGGFIKAQGFVSVYPLMASFGPELCFRFFAVLGTVHYAIGCKNAQALL